MRHSTVRGPAAQPLTPAAYAQAKRRAVRAAEADARLFAKEFPGEFLSGDWDAAAFGEHAALQGFTHARGHDALWPVYQDALHRAVRNAVAQHRRDARGVFVHAVPGGGRVRFVVEVERIGAQPRAVLTYPAGSFARAPGVSAATAYPRAAIERFVSRLARRPVRFRQVLDTGAEGATQFETWQFTDRVRTRA